MGAESSKPSKRSISPPWPGKIVPESLTCSDLFNIDSTKSPQVPNMEMINATLTHCHFAKDPKYCSRFKATPIAKINPPKKPSHVLLGEIRSNSFLRPKLRPDR